MVWFWLWLPSVIPVCQPLVPEGCTLFNFLVTCLGAAHGSAHGIYQGIPRLDCHDKHHNTPRQAPPELYEMPHGNRQAARHATVSPYTRHGMPWQPPRHNAMATPTAFPTATLVATPMATPTASPTASPVANSTASPTATAAATLAVTHTVIPTASPTASPMATPAASHGKRHSKPRPPRSKSRQDPRHATSTSTVKFHGKPLQPPRQIPRRATTKLIPSTSSTIKSSPANATTIRD